MIATEFKIGDTIHRKDLPNLYFKIVGVPSLNFWSEKNWAIQLIDKDRELIGMVAKDDLRWEVVQ